RANVDGAAVTGLRASPIVAVGDPAPMVSVSMPQCWQNFPRALTATADRIIVGWFPEQWADLHELQGGEQKTHECYLSFGPDPVTGRPLTWSRARLVAGVDPAWYARSSAAPYLSPAAAGSAGGYQASVNLAIDGNDTFHAKRERVDEY